MPELKPGWRRWRFDQMATSVTKRVDDPRQAGVEHYVGLEHLDSDSLKIRRWGRPEDVSATKLLFEPGDIIFGRRRAYQRKLGVAEFRGIASAHSLVLRAKPEVVLPEFLPSFMQSDLFMDRAQEISVGSLSPTINWKTLARQEFSLPPLEEQRNLVGLYRSAFDTVDESREVLSAWGDVRRSAIDSLVHGCSRKRVRLGAHCEMQNGRPFPGGAYQDRGIRLLRPGNLGQAGYLEWDESKTVHLAADWVNEAPEFVVGSGDLLINLTAQSLEDGFMGRVCLARDGDTSLLNQRIGRLVRFSPELLPRYLFRVLQCSSFQQHAISMCQGTKVKHLFWTHLERFEFPLPELPTQQDIVRHLDAIDDARTALQSRAVQNVEVLRELVNSIANHLGLDGN